MNKKIIGVIVITVLAFGAGYAINHQNDKNTPSNNDVTSSGGTTLDLSGQQLTAIPSSVLSRNDVTSLNLSNNQLVSVPPEITQLTNLKILNVENNRITSFPSEISQMTNLREILANNNRLINVPSAFNTMTWLQVLDISGNNIPSSEASQLKTNLPNTQVKI